MSGEDLSFLAKNSADDALRELGLKVRALLEKRQEIAFAEEKLRELQEQERSLSGEEIPQILLSRGLDSVRLSTGEKVEVVEKLAASMPKDPEKRRVVLNWLIENSGGHLVKQELTIEDPEEELVSFLRKRKIPFHNERSVNTNSFQAFLRAQLGMKKGSLQVIEVGEIPREANPFIYKETKIG